MTLQSEASPLIENVTPKDIHRMIWDDACRGEFLILCKSDMTYMQTAGSGPPFALEHQDGSLNRHFELPAITDRAELERIFQWYLVDDPRWRLLHWKKVEL